ncbi:hypothetical protein HHK36_018858 [Tetracentron sinense]|uniref:Phosphoinositide phospholipase C n=1 Tax=Tetracentron sinense TaxID=13715 RepID=A0A834YSZ9_TETSI|nr:hypothetical protein HHK36_018858 [Tetracentron sinense]
MGNYRMCMFFTRKFRMNEAQSPPDVKEAFARFSENGTQMTADQLRRFLVEFQGDTASTISDAERIIEQILQRRHHIAQFTRHTLTLDDFHHYLFSHDLNTALRSQVHQDMTAPLSHYFIYTGHNSYLTGNQLSSDCSDVPIIKALKRGVRVIELDIWPNSEKDDVHVLHGRTLTSPVALIKCLRSIKEHAFSASPYPVIITLEDHLTPDLQAKVAQMVTQTFGEMLFYPEKECLKELPSPEALKYRIILSTKPPKEYLEAKSSKDKRNEPQMDNDSSDEEALRKEVPNLEPEVEDKSDSDSSEHDEDDEDNDECDGKSHQSGAPEYKRLIAIHAGKPKGGLKELLTVELDKVRRLSLSEQALEKATNTHGTDLVRFCQKNILRVYPKGTRFTSSNYNPLIGWMHGAQMVAFNMQGMFRSNGGCGYVKKPDILMKVGPYNWIFDPKVNLPVRIYMGDGWDLDFKKTHFDSYSPPDFYTKIGIAGVPADVTMRKTKTLEDDWAPVWDEVFTFPLTVPELALLRIAVYEYDKSQKDDFGGVTCLPVSELRPGIRAVPLHDHKGVEFKSVKLLMRFKIAVAEAPVEIKNMFYTYSENGTMTVDHLHRFLVEVQGEDKATKEEARAIIDSLKHLNIFPRRGLNLEAFFRYLFGDNNLPLSPSRLVHHDMTAPLSHYFIYTSHNSYLTGNQLSSDSSDAPIIKALGRGVRVIELDMWPNSTKTNVDVLHGRTLTTPVELIKCLRSIKEHAFSASEYPVVITLEDHLTRDLQAKVAKMVTQTFGDMLFTPGSESLKEFPSPESLKKRMIISTKPPKEYNETKISKEKVDDLHKGKDSDEEEALGMEIPDQEKDMDEEEDHQDEEDLLDGDRKLQQNAAPEYKNLIGIHAGKLKGGLKDWLRVDANKVRRLSLSEQELENAVITHGRDIIRFTQQNLLRVYPKGVRFDSSNYDPLIGWMHGAQMVAFNMQGYGKLLWLMHGMFKANGGYGYVKKPDFLLKIGPDNEVFDPKASLSVKKILKVSGSLPKLLTACASDFSFAVGIAGVPADSKMKKTKAIEDNWTPVWNEEFEFPLTVPELALLRIEVLEYDLSATDDFGGQTCLPVSDLRTGIRAVPLCNHKGEKYPSVKLLMRFEFV